MNHLGAVIEAIMQVYLVSSLIKCLTAHNGPQRPMTILVNCPQFSKTGGNNESLAGTVGKKIMYANLLYVLFNEVLCACWQLTKLQNSHEIDQKVNKDVKMFGF